VDAQAAGITGVRRTLTLPRLTAGDGCTSGNGYCINAIVATCAELHEFADRLTGCVDGEPIWLDADAMTLSQTRGAELRWFGQSNYHALTRTGVVASTPAPTATIHGDAWAQLQPVDAGVLLPPSVLSDEPLPPKAQVDVLVLGEPGRGLNDRIERAGLLAEGGTAWTFENYDFVAGLRAIVWSVAAVILSVGLLAFGVASIDRATSRRREMIALQLVGVPPALLRRTQWVEAVLPIGIGTVLAIGLGMLGGATYLSLAEDLRAVPWSQSLTLAVVSVISAASIAGLTVLAAGPRIRPELIRAE
jgi:hypothetical protein